MTATSLRKVSTYEWYDHLAIRVSLERVWRLQLFPQNLVIVYFSIHCQGDCTIGADERLGAGV